MNLPSAGHSRGALIKRRREELGLSQAQLASALHWTPSMLSRIEAGQDPSLQQCEELAVALWCHPAAFAFPGWPFEYASVVGETTGEQQ